MEIIRTYPDTLRKRDIYKFVDDPDIVAVKNAVGTVLTPDAFVVYRDTQTISGEEKEVEIIAIRDRETGTVFASNSKYLREEFIKIMDNYLDPDDPEPVLIELVEGTSKAGRSYKTCKLL